MNRVGIIGYGRFGKLLASILQSDFKVIVFDKEISKVSKYSDNITLGTLEDTLVCPTIFYSVPISKFEKALTSHIPLLKKSNEKKTLIDVLSVKVYPKTIFERYLPDNCEAMLTHPMFGPDSYSLRDSSKLPIVVDKFMASKETYAFWTKYFEKKDLIVVNLTAEEHDKMAAYSQGVTHFIGRILDDLNMKATPIDTLGAKKLLDIKIQTCNDSWELFTDLQTKNPFTKEMRVELGNSLDNMYNKLLPNRTNKETYVLGIQGGPGSFNEQAALYYLMRYDITSYDIKYLYTTEKVLEELHKGNIDRGQFAIHNSMGGMVEESIHAMANYKLNIVEEFSIKIAHTLMIHPETIFEEINAIMSHPQVFKQCKNSLSKKYAKLKQISGEGELIDHANVAKYLHEGKLPKNIGTIGSSILADMYDLKIVEENLQDLHDNYTSFLLVQRPPANKSKKYY